MIPNPLKVAVGADAIYDLSQRVSTQCLSSKQANL